MAEAIDKKDVKYIPSFDEVLPIVDGLINPVERKNRAGDVTGHTMTLLKTNSDKVLKDFGVDLDVVKKYEDIVQHMDRAVVERGISFLADKAEKAKASGSSEEVLRDLSTQTRAVHVTGTTRSTICAYAESRNPLKPDEVRAPTVPMVRLRLTHSRNRDWVKDHKDAARLKAALGV